MIKYICLFIAFICFNTAYAQLALKNDTNKVVPKSTYKTEIDVSRYLTNTKPFPLPAKNKIFTSIAWFTLSENRNPYFELYDINGFEIKNAKFEFATTALWSGNLTLDCSMLEQGVYFIQVKLTDNSLAIPIIVSK